MLSDANREIRAQIDRSIERRLQRSADLVAFEYLDELIAALEELHMRDQLLVPTAFDPRLERLTAVLPSGIKRPHRWPVRIRDLIDVCFDLQEQLLWRRPHPKASPLCPDAQTDIVYSR